MANAIQSKPAANAITLVMNKDTLKGVLDKPDFIDSIRAVASQYLTQDRATKIALLACSRQPKLWSCTVNSFVQSVIKATELGLEFGGSTGQGYLVPYKNGYLSKQMNRDVYEAQFIPGYRGFIELAYRSGKVLYVDSQLVYEKDTFDYGFEYGGTGKTPFISHRPSMEENRGKLICAYSVVMLKDSPIPKIDFMTVHQLEQIRNCSKSKNDGPWQTFPEEMQKKSIIRRSFKWIPTSPQLALAEELDNQDYDMTRAATALPAGGRQRLGTDGCRDRMLAALGQSGDPATDQPAVDTEFVAEGGAEARSVGAYDFAQSVSPDDPETQSAGFESTAEPGIGVGEGPEEDRGYACENHHTFAEPRMNGKRAQCPQCSSTRIQKL